MKTLHTPGPWHVTTALSGKRAIAQSKDLYSVAIIEQWRGEESEANAPAPELLQLAKHIIAMEDDAHFCEHPEWAAIVKQAFEVTEKATGEKESNHVG